MQQIEDVVEKIKKIDCQADRIEVEIKNAFNGYTFDGADKVIVKRDEKRDNGDLKAYDAYIDKSGAPNITVLVNEGLDHYVSTVKDAFLL